MKNIWTPSALHYAKVKATKGKRGDQHMSKICQTVEDYIIENTNSQNGILKNRSARVRGKTLNKCWDLLVKKQTGIAAIEFKSITQSSFGKHFSSRVEEALGAAIDARSEQQNVWLGYILVYDLDAPISEAKQFKQIERCKSFLDNLKNEYNLYDSTHLISIDNTGVSKELYNNGVAFLASLAGFINK